MKHSTLFLIAIFAFVQGVCGQNKTISVLGEAKGTLNPEYAVFEVQLTDEDCSSRFPDIQSKQRRYAEVTKDNGIPAADNLFLKDVVRRQESYDGAKDVHLVSYQVTVRNRETILYFIGALESDIPGTKVIISEVEFGNSNATREVILSKAYADARHRAEVFAKESGATLGQVLAIKEEHFDDGGSVIERIFMADKLYKRDAVAAGYLRLFPDFSVTVRIDFELITKP